MNISAALKGSACELVERSVRCHTGLPIPTLRALCFHQFCASLIFLLMTNPTYVFKHIKIWFKHNIVHLEILWPCLYHRMMGKFTWNVCLANPGQARGCSTNTSVTHYFINYQMVCDNICTAPARPSD